MDQDETWHGGRPKPSPHCARWGVGTQLPLPQSGTAPQFSTHVCCGQTAGWIKVPLGRQVGLGPGDIVLNGDPGPPKKGHSTPQFLDHVYCGQTAGWIKMSLCTKVDLGPGHIVLDGAQLHHQKGGTAPSTFRPMSIVIKWLDGSFATWYEGRPWPRPNCVR